MYIYSENHINIHIHAELVYIGQVNWRPVLWGLALQFLLGVSILRWTAGYEFFNFLGIQVKVEFKSTSIYIYIYIYIYIIILINIKLFNYLQIINDLQSKCF